MKKIIRTAAAVAAFSVAGLGMVGVAVAEEPAYVPQVEGITQVQDPGVQAVTVSGSLPYTGTDSSLPLAEAGVALVAGGGALLLVVKRRQSSNA
jgi:LPXTG-motif cell wall-anchored protein